MGVSNRHQIYTISSFDCQNLDMLISSTTLNRIIQDKDNQVFEPEIHPKLKHNRKGIVSMALVPCDGRLMAGSQFLITLVDTHLEYLDRKQAIFGQVAEGFETLDKINDAICDQEGRPYRDIR